MKSVSGRFPPIPADSSPIAVLDHLRTDTNGPERVTEPFGGDPMVQISKVFESRTRLSTKLTAGPMLMSAFRRKPTLTKR